MIRLCGSVLLAVAILACPLPAEETRVKGAIKSVDADKGILRVTVEKKDVEFKVTDDTKLTAAPEGKRIKDRLRSPLYKAGTEVGVTTDTRDGKEVVLLIRLYPPEGGAAPVDVKKVKGVVQELDAKLGTITLRLGSSKTGEVETFNLARPDLPVTDSAGKALTLQQVRVGVTVSLTPSALDDIVAIQIVPEKKSGTVVRVDADARRLQVKSNGGSLTLYTLGRDARLTYRDEPAPLTSLKPGMKVNLGVLGDEIVQVSWTKQK